MSQNRRRVIRLLVAGSAALVVAGCREDEQDRPLSYQKGTYQGAPDAPLDPGQVERLRQRARQQRQ